MKANLRTVGLHWGGGLGYTFLPWGYLEMSDLSQLEMNYLA